MIGEIICWWKHEISPTQDFQQGPNNMAPPNLPQPIIDPHSPPNQNQQNPKPNQTQAKQNQTTKLVMNMMKNIKENLLLMKRMLANQI